MFSSCYKYFGGNSAKRWQQAKDTCQQDSARLIKIDNSEKMKHLEEYLSKIDLTILGLKAMSCKQK